MPTLFDRDDTGSVEQSRNLSNTQPLPAFVDLTGWGRIDLGKHSTACAVRRAVVAFSRQWVPGTNPWATVALLQVQGLVPADVLPPGVKRVRCKSGVRYRGRGVVQGVTVRTRPYRTAAEAWLALRDALQSVRAQYAGRGLFNPETGQVRPRERRHPSRYEGVRKVKGKCAYQCRYWLGGRSFKTIHLNLGLFTSGDHGDDAEWAAGRAWREFDKRWVADPVTRVMPSPWSVVVELRRKGYVPSSLVPPWVYAVPGGYAARSRMTAGVIELPGPYATPEEAHEAMAERLGLWPITRSPMGRVSAT